MKKDELFLCRLAPIVVPLLFTLFLVVSLLGERSCAFGFYRRRAQKLCDGIVTFFVDNMLDRSISSQTLSYWVPMNVVSDEDSVHECIARTHG